MRILLIIILLLNTAVWAQLKPVVKGKTYTSARKENFNGFLGENSSAIFTVDYFFTSRKKQELLIRKFDKKDFELMGSTNIYEIPQEGFWGEPLEVFYKNDSLFLFSNLYDETNKIMLISFEIYNIDGIKLMSAIVDTVPDDESLEIVESLNKEEFVLIRSNKFSNLTEQEISMKLISLQGTINFQKLVKSPMALQNLTIEKICHVKGSPVFVICNYNFDPNNLNIDDNREMINNKYALWAYDPEQNFLKEFEIRLRGKWLNGIEMEINSENNLVVTGYFNESRYYTISGIFNMIVDKDLKIISTNFQSFDQSIIDKFVEDKTSNKKTELEDYKLMEMHLFSDASFFIVGERNYKYIERNYDPRTNITTTIEHFNYNSIILSYFSKDGKHIWTDRIPKYQTSTNDMGYYSSFATLNTGQNIYFFFNDSEKNNDLALDDYFNYKGLFNNRRFQITAVQADTSGLISRKPLVGVDNSFLLRAKESNQVSNKVMYLMTEYGRDSKIFSVEAEK